MDVVILSGLCTVQEGRPVCVEVDPETEAVKGEFMKLKCVYCMKREEISATTTVEWYYIGPDKREVLVSSPLRLFLNTHTFALKYVCIVLMQ